MMRTTKGALVVALGTAATLSLAACGSSSSSSSSGGGDSKAENAGNASKGGTLTMLNLGPKEHLDPQRMYIGADMLFASRTYARSLETYKPGSKDIAPDLATDKGTMSDGGKTWKFTLAGGAKWQDGKAVTCEDLKYGVSRTFAQDTITGGPNYAITFLDIPTKKGSDGSDTPIYTGPYKSDAAGQAAFDKAITCSGDTITYHFKKPWTDFNQATAALTAFSPFRKDQDKGAQSDFAPFSDGPYMLQGTFDANKGGTFVRNPNWDGSKDPIRKAYPDKIVDVEGVPTETQYQRAIADSGDDQAMIPGVQAPPSILPQIVGNQAAKDRSLTVGAPYVDYLAPNFKSKTMSNPKVRQALAMATNRGAYVTAYGGTSVDQPSLVMCNKTMKCNSDTNPFGNDANGDVAGAKKLLQEAGVQTPLPITVVYRKRPTSDKAFNALKQTWDQAGFNVTLQGITDKYYATIQAPGMADKDVFWASWGADWPSGSTVIPALFDDRVNVSAGGSGQDYGYYKSAEADAKMDQAYAIQDESQREKAWSDIDAMIGKDGGYVSLVNQKFTFMRGSKVKNFKTNDQMGGYPDLAETAVQ